MKIGIWLASILPTLTAKILASLGLGVITVTGFNIAWSALQAIIISNFGAMPASIIGLASLAGVGEGLGIIFGAIAARVSFAAVMSAAKIGGVAS